MLGRKSSVRQRSARSWPQEEEQVRIKLAGGKSPLCLLCRVVSQISLHNDLLPTCCGLVTSRQTMLACQHTFTIEADPSLSINIVNSITCPHTQVDTPRLNFRQRPVLGLEG